MVLQVDKIQIGIINVVRSIKNNDIPSIPNNKFILKV